MNDFTKLSNEELTALYQQNQNNKGIVTVRPTSASDFTKMSNEELLSAYQQRQQPNASFSDVWGNTSNAVPAAQNQPTQFAPEVDRILAREAPNNRQARVEQHVRRLEADGANPAADSIVQGLTYGLSDELGAALQALRGAGNYGEILDAERERINRARQDSPVTSTALEVFGAVANPISRGLGAANAATRGERFARGALEAGALGGLYGFNQGQDGFENRISNAATSAIVAAPIGGAINAALPAVRAAPTQTKGSQVAEAAERLGVNLPRAVTSDSASVQQAGKIAANVPWAGQPLRQASQSAIQQVDDATRNIATQYGNANANAATAGATLRSGLQDYIGPTTSGRVQKLYDAVDNLVNPNALTPVSNTAAAAQDIIARRGAAALNPESSAVRQVLDATQRQHGLSYEGIKTLRTSIGEMLKSSNLPADISQAELKTLYGALTKDLQASVQNAGGQKALSAWQRANNYNKLVMDRRENLNRLLKVNSDEQLFERILGAAQTKGKADTALLSQARKALPADEWNELAAGVINRMGRDAEGNLTPDRFVTAYGNLSPAGKSLLFRSTGQSQLANSLDDVALVMSRFKQLNQYANPSGTAQSIIGGATGFGVMADPVTTLTSAMTARVMSGLLARPQSAQSIARWSNAYYNAVAKPTRATMQAFDQATRRFADDIGRQLGVPQHAEALFRQLQGAVRAPAEDQRGQ